MHAIGLKTTRNPWLWIPSLYLAEGLPNAIVVTVAVVLLKNLGMDNSHVALYTSLLYIPWVIKPFWAPFVDILSSKRHWIIAMQLLIFASAAAVALLLPVHSHIAALLAAFWSMAFASATHDIAADGFYMLGLDGRRQAFFVGIRSTFYRLANLLASGGLVWLAGRMMEAGTSASSSWQAIFTAIALFFCLCALWHHMILPRPDADHRNAAQSAGAIFRDFALSFKTFFTKPGIAPALAFMLLYRLPEALLGKMVQPFLLDPAEAGGLALTTAQVGLANGTYGVAGIVAGGIVGGMCIARFGLRRCMWPMALMLTLPSALYCFLAAGISADMPLICAGIAFEQFGYGFGFTAYMVYLMKFCEGSAYTTSHYAFSTGIMALGLMLPGLFAGALQHALGYLTFFIVVMALSPATFIVTDIIRRRL